MKKLELKKGGLTHVPTKLTVIRHGETALNAKQVNRGHVEVPLNATGRKQAIAVAPKVKKAGVQVLVSSDLGRSRETAQIISKHTGIPHAESTPALRPWDLGRLSGKGIMESLPTLQDHMKNKPNVKLPGGESFNNFKVRTAQGLKSITTKYAGQHVGLVTHHRVERYVDGYLKAGVHNDLIDVNKMMVKGADPGSATTHIVLKK